MKIPTIPEVMPLVREYYSIPGNSAGGSLHVVLDDGNIGDDSIRFCLCECDKDSDKKGAELCKLLLRMSKTQRKKIYQHVRER